MRLISRLFARTPEDHRPIPAVAAANAVLDAAASAGASVNAPRLQRLVMLADRMCQVRLGRRLVDSDPTLALDMPFHASIHDAFRRWGAEPIRAQADHPQVRMPFIAAIDDERLGIIAEAVGGTATMPTHRIPHTAPDGAVWRG